MPTQVTYPVTSPKSRQQTISGYFTIGAAGAISEQANLLDVGLVATKTAAETGRYSIAFPRAYKTKKVVHVNMVGPADAAFGNTDANTVQARNFTTSGVDIQGSLASTGADTDFASGTLVMVTVIVAD